MKNALVLVSRVLLASTLLWVACSTANPEPVFVGEPDPDDPDPCDEPSVYCFTFGPVEVPAGGEWQGYLPVKIEADDDLAIVHMEVSNAGAISHHFIVGLWNDDERDPPAGGPFRLESPEGLRIALNNMSLIGSVYKYVRIDTGKHMGVALPANSWLALNAHFINVTDEPVLAETYLVVRTVPQADVRFLAVNHLAGTTNISVPPGQTTTSGGTFSRPYDLAVVLMTSHMHRHGRWFRVWLGRDGDEELIYETDDYDSPPLRIFTGGSDEPPLVLRAESGDYLRYECTFTNDTFDFTIGYGPSADTDEMCTMPVYVVDEPDALVATLEAEPDSGFLWEYE
jgi:hypothetical protein